MTSPMTLTTNGNGNGNGSPKADGDGYPVFQPNQVLSDRDLNRIVSYLDSQSRLTRTYAIGMGILCGLTVEVQEETGNYYKIIIAEGCGITSVGYLIPYQHFGDSEDDYAFTHFRVIQLERQKFGLTENPQELVKMRELVTNTTVEAEQQQETDFSQLTKKDVENMAIAVLYDWEDSRRDSCMLDCDDQGMDRHFQLRFFLLDLKPLPTPLPTGEEDSTSTPPWLDATTLLKEGYQISADVHLEAYFQSWYQVPDLTIKRLGYQSDSGRIDLSSINDVASFKAAYQEICDLVISSDESIPQAFSQIHELFGPFSGAWQPQANDFENLQEHLNNELQKLLDGSGISPYGIQYFYDYLVDLIATYQELKDTMFDLMADCLPDPRRFPNYLLLGEVLLEESETCTPPNLYRHHFTQPPIYNGNARRLKEARHIYERLLQMSKNFELPSSEAKVKVTPSRSRLLPLGKQAIPYYYKDEALLPYWNYDACRQGRHKKLPTSTSDHFHLSDRLDWSDFFRIEGHVGKKVEEAEDAIDELRQDFNLAFDLITIRISEGASLGDYAKQYPGLEHLGGVPQGGTFVLVYTDKDSVIGDFCFPYCYKPPVSPAENCFQEFCLTICKGFQNLEKIFWIRERRDGKTTSRDNLGRLYRTTN